MPRDSGLMIRSQQDLLDLADRVLDSDFTLGLKAGEGYELLQAFALALARASTAIRTTGDGLFASYASGGSYATGTVEFYRTTPLGPAVTVRTGTVVQAEGGKLFRTIEDAVFAYDDVGPETVRIRSVFPEFRANTDGQVTTSGGLVIPGEIQTIRSMVQDPPLADPTIKVRQIDPTTGGRDPMLDLVAYGNNLPRNIGETDESLAYRTRNLPDNLTPGAMGRMLRTLLSPYGASWELLDSSDPEFQGAYDMDSGVVFQYDDERPRYFPSVNWLPDDREQWGTFYVVISEIQPILDFGGAYDDSIPTTAAELVSPVSGGRRAVPAYDLTESGTFGGVDALRMAYDGRDVGQDALLQSVNQQMQSLRAAGIVAGLNQEGH